MKREELDTLWFQAMRQSIEEGEDFIRYHFAALVAAAEREACAKVCDDHHRPDADLQQGIWVLGTAITLAAAIRARGQEVQR